MARPLLTVESASKTYGTRSLLDGVTLGLSAGDRVGVVGRNGGGKTTLLEVLAGRTPVDAGRVVRAGDLRVSLLRQADELPPESTVRAAVLGDRPEHEWAGDAGIRDVLGGLLGGLAGEALPEGLDGRIATLSGGERRRVALAAMLTREQDVVMLDEPTNHLDVEGVAWLADHLNSRRELRGGALVVVTHDRWFLDAVCNATWEVHGGQVSAYEGSYAAYVLAKAERSRQATAEEQRRQNLMRKELAWLRRGAPARTTKAKYRVDAANELIAAEPPPRDPDTLMRFASTRLGKTVVDLENVTLRAGDRELLSDVTWQLGPGDRIGVVGVNGAGKSTFLRLLTGLLEPTAGVRKAGKTVLPAYLPQEVRFADLTGEVGARGDAGAPVATEGGPAGDRRVLQAVEDVRQVFELGNGRTMSAGQLCERFGFVGEGQRTPVRDLSGGERRRLQLLRLLMGNPNVLLLDEPTNDLDVETLNALEDLLDGWAGSLVVVSHDRYFLERVCDRVLGLLGDGGLRDLPRGVDEYLELRRARAATPTASKNGGTGTKGPNGRSVRTGSEERDARKELARIERRLDKVAEREERLHDDIAAAAAEYDRLGLLDRELKELQAEKRRLEDQWLIASETLE